MKGIKLIRIDNFKAYKQEIISFSRDGQKESNHTDNFMKFILEYLIKGQFLDTPDFTTQHIFHKPVKTDVNKAPRVKNLYMCVEFYSRDNQPLSLELYAYSDVNKKDYVLYRIGDKAYQFYILEGQLNLPVHSLLMNNILEECDL